MQEPFKVAAIEFNPEFMEFEKNITLQQPLLRRLLKMAHV